VHPLDFDDPRVVEAIKRTIAAALRDRVLDRMQATIGSSAD